MKLRLLNTLCAALVMVGAMTVTHAAPVNGQGTWETTLQGRDLDGDPATYEAYYDTTLDITWLADANYAETLGYPNDGRMNWAAANAWAATLNIHDVTGWRLPTLTPVNGHTFNMCYREDGSTDAGYALTTTDGTDGGWRDASGNPVSEMGHMYYVTLGNQAHSRSNTGPFYNFGHLYWTDKIVNASLGYGAIFNPQLGNQGYYWLTSPLHFWVVRDGDLVTKVLIDIKPGSEPNSINPRSKGKIPVAIISTMDFDASVEVDTGSLTFGPNGNEQSFAFCNESPEDVNDDGYDDLVCHFYTQEAGFECGDEEGYLRGELVDGTPIEGSDSVRIVPCR